MPGFLGTSHPCVSIRSNYIPLVKMYRQCNNLVIPRRMLDSFSLAPSFRQIPAAIPSPQFRLFSPPPNLAHNQIPLPPNRPFRMIRIRIAPRVNPFPSKRYKFPYRAPMHSSKFFVLSARILGRANHATGQSPRRRANPATGQCAPRSAASPQRIAVAKRRDANFRAEALRLLPLLAGYTRPARNLT
jgi:hypothetical protein